jgi:crossover junction endodeoxyribonuclease RuvC
MSKRMLAVDPGTSCGYAWLDISSPVPPGIRPLRTQAGVWDLSVKRHEGGGMRFVRFKKYLKEMNPDFVLYEEVRAHRGTSAAHVYGGLIAILQEYCEEHSIQHVGIPVGTIKKRATTKGNSNKQKMVAAANKAFIRSDDEVLDESDDDIADAMWLLQVGIDEYGAVISEGGK